MLCFGHLRGLSGRKHNIGAHFRPLTTRCSDAASGSAPASGSGEPSGGSVVAASPLYALLARPRVSSVLRAPQPQGKAAAAAKAAIMAAQVPNEPIRPPMAAASDLGRSAPRCARRPLRWVSCRFACARRAACGCPRGRLARAAVAPGPYGRPVCGRIPRSRP